MVPSPVGRTAPLPWPHSLSLAGLADKNAFAIREDGMGELVEALLKHRTGGCFAAGSAENSITNHTVWTAEDLPRGEINVTGLNHNLSGLAGFVYSVALEMRSRDQRHRPQMRLFLSQLMHMDQEHLASECAPAAQLFRFIQAETLLFAILPIASNAASWTIWGATIIAAWELSQDIYGVLSWKRTAVLEVLWDAWRRVRRLQGLLSSALKEPWLSSVAPARRWLRDEDLVRTFRQHWVKYKAVPVVNSDPELFEFQSRLDSKARQTGLGGVGSCASAQREAFLEIRVLLEAVRHKVAPDLANSNATILPEGFDGTWWPMKGTLIAMLRHGCWQGELADGKIDVADRDMDFSVLVGDAATWFHIVVFLTRALIAKGWLGCFHTTHSWQHPLVAWTALAPQSLNQTRDAALDGRGPAILQCVKRVEAEGTSVEFELLWHRLLWLSEPPRSVLDCLGHNPISTGASTKSCYHLNFSLVSVRIESVDLERGFVNHLERAAKTARGMSHLVLDTNPLCQNAKAKGACYLSRSYPYQCWPGGVPAGCVLPLGARCGAYNTSVPCPRSPTQLLKWFNDGVYWAQHPGQRCLALPDVGKGLPGRVPSDPRNRRLIDEGITVADVNMLLHTARRLRQRGFQAFAETDFAECKSSIADASVIAD